MGQPTEHVKELGDRKVLSTLQEVRAAIVEVAGLADRTLTILTSDLEPEIYDHETFLEVLKRFILSRSFARVRVLIMDPARAMKEGNHFVDMGRRLNSYIEFRNAKPHLRQQSPAYCIADNRAIVYRARTDSWNAVADTHEPAVARKYLEEFDELWHACEPEPELRRLHSL
jgi:hypothetical protein